MNLIGFFENEMLKTVWKKGDSYTKNTVCIYSLDIPHAYWFAEGHGKCPLSDVFSIFYLGF